MKTEYLAMRAQAARQGKTGITRVFENSFAGPYLLRAPREAEELRRFELG